MILEGAMLSILLMAAGANFFHNQKKIEKNNNKLLAKKQENDPFDKKSTPEPKIDATKNKTALSEEQLKKMYNELLKSKL